MRDRFERRQPGPAFLECPLCGARGVYFTGVGFSCAGGCSATAKEITEAGENIEKLKEFLRAGQKRNLDFEKKNRTKKKRRRRSRNQPATTIEHERDTDKQHQERRTNVTRMAPQRR